MKKSILFFILFLFSCNQQPQTYWDHQPFSKPPQMPLAQAQAICQGISLNAGNYVQRESVPTTMSCNSYMGYSTINTQCSETTNGFAELAATLNYNAEKDEAINNTYKSCMATNGWQAILTQVISQPDDTATKEAAYQACVEAHGVKMIDCESNIGIVSKQEFCHCRVDGGQVLSSKKP